MLFGNFFSEADPTSPGTDKDIDYYQHKSTSMENYMPQRTGWEASGDSKAVSVNFLFYFTLMILIYFSTFLTHSLCLFHVYFCTFLYTILSNTFLMTFHASYFVHTYFHLFSFIFHQALLCRTECPSMNTHELAWNAARACGSNSSLCTLAFFLKHI